MGERAGLHEDEGEEEGDGDDSTIRISSSHAHRHRLIQAPPVPPARSSSLRPPAVDPFIAPSQTQQQGAGGLPSFQVTQPTPTKLRHNPGGLATTDASEVSPTPGPSSRLPNQQYGANFASGAVDIQVDTHDHPVSAEPSSYAVLSVASGSTHGTEPASTSWHPNVPAVPGQALTTDEDESAEELMERAKAKEAKANRAREMGRLRQRKKRERDRQAKEVSESRCDDPPCGLTLANIRRETPLTFLDLKSPLAICLTLLVRLLSPLSRICPSPSRLSTMLR